MMESIQNSVLEGYNNQEKLHSTQRRGLDESKGGLRSFKTLVKEAEPVVEKISNKMVFARGSKPGNFLVAHHKEGYQIFENGIQTAFKGKTDVYRGSRYCDVAHNGSYYFLVSGVYRGNGGSLYLIKEGTDHPCFPLISHSFDTPFIGKSLYPNPFNSKMTLFCDPCHGTLQCFILGADSAIQKAMEDNESRIEEYLAQSVQMISAASPLLSRRTTPPLGRRNLCSIWSNPRTDTSSMVVC